MAAIEMRGVWKRFGDTVAVRELDLEIAEGETLALVGSSGGGKTTTLRMINRLVEPSQGELRVMGEDVRGVDPSLLRRRIGYVIQEAGLFRHWTVERNVGVVPRLLGWPEDRIAARGRELLELVGLPADEFGARYPGQLSGGQRQRVGIARALAADPTLVLLDEPFGALDPITREHIQDEFIELSARLKKTFVLVTHDIFEAVRLADRIGVMDGGRLVRCATPADLVCNPGHPYVEALLGRHRLQLRLMTVRLASMAGRGSPDAPQGASITLPGTATAWDALLLSEVESARHIGIEGESGVRYVDRDALLEART